jgi:hypothetical protein
MDDQFRGPRTTSINALELLRTTKCIVDLLALEWLNGRVFLVFCKVFLFLSLFVISLLLPM